VGSSYSVCFLSILLTTHEHIFPRISVDKQQQQTDNMSFGEKKKKLLLAIAYLSWRCSE